MSSGELNQFLISANWGGSRIDWLVSDASERRYARIQHEERGQAILMDASAEQVKSVDAFVRMTHFLRDQGLSAPDLFAVDLPRAFLLLEDLGSDLYAEVIKKKSSF